MIPRLTQSSLSFRANENSSVRDAYDSQVAKNSQTAQKQNQAIINMTNHIPMQGNGQKLDVIA